MAHQKDGQPPARKKRDKNGRFVKGNPGGGRPAYRAEFKEFAQEKSIEALRVVYDIMFADDTNKKDKLTAARLLMEYGYGRPAAELDTERLQIDRGRLALEERRLEIAQKAAEQSEGTADVAVEWDGAEELAE